MTCTLSEITCNVSQIFICAWLVFGGIFWTCGVCVCVCVCALWRATARHNAHTHMPQVQNMPPSTDHAHDKYLWTITSNISHSTGHHSLMMDPLWFEILWSIQHFNFQLMHTTLKNVELLKHFNIPSHSARYTRLTSHNMQPQHWQRPVWPLHYF